MQRQLDEVNKVQVATQKKKIVAIVGTRDAGFNKLTYHVRSRQVVKILNKYNKLKTIVMSGGCPTGADHHAKRKAFELGFSYIEVPPNWTYQGPAAGPIRNQLIADLCDELWAIWDGNSRGTMDVIDKVKKLGKDVYVMEP